MTPARYPNGDPTALPPGPPLLPAVDRPGGGDPTVLVPAEDPPALSTRITPAALLRALRRCWVVAVPVGMVLAAAVAAGVWTLRTDKYASTALIRVLPASATKLLDDQGRQPDNGPVYMRTQIATIRSKPVLQKALKDEKIKQHPMVARYPNPVEWLEKDLQVLQIDGTDYIRLSLTARGDGSGLAPLLNAVTKSYLEVYEQFENQAQNKILIALEDALRKREEQLRVLQNSIRDTSRTLRGGDPQVLLAKQQSANQEKASLKAELLKVEARKRDLELREKVLKRRLETVTAAAAGGTAAAAVAGAAVVPRVPPAADSETVKALVEREVDTDHDLRQLKAAVGVLKGNADLIAGRAVDPELPAIVAARAKHAEAEKQLEAARADKRAVVMARSAAVDRATTTAALAEVQDELGLLNGQRADLQKAVDKAAAELDSLGLGGVDLEMKRDEAERSEQFVRLLWEQKERMDLELKRNNRERVKEFSAADEATMPSPNGRLLEAAGGGLAGLLLGLFVVSFREARRGRIHRPADVARGLRLPVLGTLPVAPAGSLVEALQQAGATAGRYNRGLVESADALRTRLLRGRVGGRCPVLMVASPAAGEGKTTLAAQLAASLARAGYATLLVDGDLRRPSLHRLFGAAPTPGLCDLLAGEYGADAAVRPTAVENLHLLPAGALTPRASAGLAQAVVPALFDGLRARYDFVLVDSGPLLLVSDAFLLARPADGVILSVRPGVSQAADVYAAYQQLVDHHLPFTGVVVNGIPGRSRYAEAYGDRELTAPSDAPAGAEPPAEVPAAGTP